MDILFYLATACLVLFMVLATYDGFYLHMFKYKLFDREESIFEHKIHTVRAVLFPLIVYALLINETNVTLFITGIVLVLIDLLVLGLDAYYEKESRSFMGGLPKWEYIVHLFANGFHFSAIVIALALRINIVDNHLVFVNTVTASSAHDIFQFVAVNIIPGSIILALLHFILMFEKPKIVWTNYRTKITCC